jgi:fatty-acyl-CoA synthase
LNNISDEVEIISKGLITSGFKKGDKIAIWAQNSSECIMIYLACAKVGIITVLCNPNLRACLVSSI